LISNDPQRRFKDQAEEIRDFQNKDKNISDEEVLALQQNFECVSKIIGYEKLKKRIGNVADRMQIVKE